MRKSWKVKRYVLRNNGKEGITCYGQYDPGRTTWLCGIGCKVGSMHVDGGLPHLAEHLLARDCGRYDEEEVDRLFEKYADGPEGSINVRIFRTSTFLGHQGLLYKHDMVRFFDLLVNLVRHKIITTRGILSEKAAVHQEYWFNGIDPVSETIDDLMHRTMYETNPARNRIDCEPDMLLRVTPGKIRSFIRKYYVPKNMFVLILGPRVQEAIEIAENYFGDWLVDKDKNGPETKLDESEKFLALNAPRHTEVVRPGIVQSHLAIGFPTGPYMSNDREALMVLARIWAWRVRRRLRDDNQNFEEGVYRALAYTPSSFLHGMIYLWYASKSLEFVKRSEAVVLEEVERLKKDFVSGKELDAITYSLYAQHYSVFRDSPSSLAELVIEAVCNGDEKLVRLHDFGRRVRKLSAKKLRAVANRYFTKDYARVLIRPPSNGS